MTVPGYGDLLSAADQQAAPLPRPRGPLTGHLFAALHGSPVPVRLTEPKPGDLLGGEDEVLALYCLYELHYRGFADVDEGWEWEPSLLALRQRLEVRFVAQLEQLVGPPERLAVVGGSTAVDFAELLAVALSESEVPSASAYLEQHGTLQEFREFAVHRSAYQLKEADPHSWALPRLSGAAKAALVEIQADEYGRGVERDMHQTLFGLTLRGLGLDPGYHAYLDALPATTLAPVNLVSLFGLHRRWRGALVGHLAGFEMSSVAPMARSVAALRRHGVDTATQHFYAVHVVADAHHEQVAAHQLAAGLAAQEPQLAPDILFGARALTALEGRFAEHLLDCWRAGSSSLRRPLDVGSAA